jgi:hypothetical protein
VYPEKTASASKTPPVISTQWNEAARAALREGRDLLLYVRDSPAIAGTSFTTPFWSTAWFPKRTETMGILCDPSHPALSHFPTQSHSDWQWWELTASGRALQMKKAPGDLEPIVQVIDDVERNRRLAALVEARVGKGRLILTTFDLQSDLDQRIVARQLRRSIESYMTSERFQPKTRLSLEQIDELLLSPVEQKR